MFLPDTSKNLISVTLLLLGLFGSPIRTFAQTSPPSELQIADTQSPAPYIAQMTSINQSALAITQGGTQRELPVANLRRVVFQGTLPVAQGPYEVSLRDGSTFTASLITSDGPQTEFTLPSGTSKLVVPTKLLRDIRLRDLTDAQNVQWQAIRDSRLTADMLVLVRSAESLDKIEGIINSIDKDAVQFEFSGQVIPAPFSKLAGMRFYSKSDNVDAKLSAVVRDTSGHVWNANKVICGAGEANVELTLRGGLMLSIPRTQLVDIDFAVGSTKYLAEMQPVARSTVERFPLAIPVTGSESLFGARVATGSNAKYGPSIEFLGSGTSTYRIPSEFTRMVGSVELNPPGNTISPCTVQILMEKKVVWEQRLTEPKRPLPIDLPVVSDQRVQLVVQTQADLPIGDIVLFRELRFLK